MKKDSGGFLADYWDKEKPELKRGEILCGGCWTVGAIIAPVGWVYFNFKALDPVWLCPDCVEKYAEEFSAQQSAGL